jgi:hypothetical protein
MQSSVPTLEEFNPKVIPYQYEVIRDIRKKYDYSLGTHEVLLSGAVGSAKSILLAHLIVTHCVLYPFASVGIGRIVFSDLKETLLDFILKHLEGNLGRNCHHNKSTNQIIFTNGSKILPFSWKHGNLQKFRSYAFSMFAFEELSENKQEDVYDAVSLRVGRLSHVPEKLLISATNPDDPSHWIYKKIILAEKKDPTKHVYFSKTKDNPFLPKSYKEKLERDLDPKMALRMLEGQWLAIRQDVVYYEYKQEEHFHEYEYRVDVEHPIHLSFDFNIGAGKPLSMIFYQVINDEFHFFDEVIVDGARTLDAIEEAQGRGLFDYPVTYHIHGDATGSARTTNYNKSNYDIIREYLYNYKRTDGKPFKLSYEVPKSNPSLKSRHNTVNAYLKNQRGEIRIRVYGKCKVLDEGFRLTKLKDRGQYIEDDSKYYQHVTTAAGYGICWHAIGGGARKKQGTVQL